jgi:DNA repair protein RadC
LNVKNEVTAYQIVSHGTLSASLVHPREVFKAALLANSNTIIIAYNHPTGSLNPSDEDIQVTETLIKAYSRIADIGAGRQHRLQLVS